MDIETLKGPLLGGLMIGAATGGWFLLTGKTAGCSGAIYGVLVGERGEAAWKFAFLIWLASRWRWTGALYALGLAGVDSLILCVDSRQRFARGPGHAYGRRLHQRPWSLRHRPPFAAFDCGHLHFHGHSGRHGIYRAACGGGLT
jgi:hypothetical protein